MVDTDGYDSVAFYDNCSMAEAAQFTRLDTDLDSLIWSNTIADNAHYTDLTYSSDGVLCVSYQDATNGILNFGCSYDKGSSRATRRGLS